MKKEKAKEVCSVNDCRAIKDTLDVLSGSWKLPILVSLSHGPRRFKEITKDVEGISDKMLSKELKDLEMNHLVKRTVYDTFPPKVVYDVTEHTKTLNEVMTALSDWGNTHRKKITGR